MYVYGLVEHFNDIGKKRYILPKYICITLQKNGTNVPPTMKFQNK